MSEIHNIGSRLELFVDDWLIEEMEGARLLLHHPSLREVALVCDKPWEGNTCAYFTVFQDGDIYRMYYRGSHNNLESKKSSPQVTCYAESRDGIHWRKPELGLFEYQGSKKNNIVWTGTGTHNFTPFKDTNPNCKSEAKYKALAGGGGGLVAFGSPHGFRWQSIQEDPVITKGKFDSQNLAFWDTKRNRYLEFHRDLRKGVRDIMTSTSEDFIHWTEPEFLDFGHAPAEHLYTNAVRPYFRAPHILLGFPMRFMPKRKKEFGLTQGVSDGVFMTSRDGLRWHRWLEAFIRPGLQAERWEARDNMTAWGVVMTKPETPGLRDELSLYSTENYRSLEGAARLRRFTLRMDGFVSVYAPPSGGEFVTRPLVFSGKELVINFSTSAAGSVRVEIPNSQGKAMKGFALADSEEIYGDEIEHIVSWTGGSDLSKFASKPIRLRFLMKDADLYALRFK